VVDATTLALVRVVLSTGLPPESLITTSRLVMSAAPNGSLTAART